MLLRPSIKTQPAQAPHSNADQPAEREVSISAVPSQVDEQATVIGDKRKLVGLYVVGCVTYGSNFGLTKNQVVV